MNNFEYIKSLSIDELAEWLDQHDEFDGAPWYTWFDETYCSKCESVMCKYPDSDREIPFAWCELNDECRFMDYVPEGKEIVKLWLESKFV